MSDEKNELTLLGKGGPKEKIVRDWFVRRFGDASEILDEENDASYPKGIKSKDLKDVFDADVDGVNVGYGSFNAVLKKIEKELGIETEVEINISDNPLNTPATGVVGKNAIEVNLEDAVLNIKDMPFPEVKLYTTGKPIDVISSDHEEGGGFYGGTVNIVIGESGVGKSTILLDLLKSAMSPTPQEGDESEDPICCLEKTNNLYISSEMSRNDIMFYYRKSPAIGEVPTLLLMDYIKGGMIQALEKAFRGGYDMIVFDSYQDTLIKLRDVVGMSKGAAETFLINLMMEAAEKYGTAVFAIQHMTKSGEYVGSTFLKHATTGMLEIRFTQDRTQRYLQWVKNRRGGSLVYKKLFYKLDNNGEVVYDIDRLKKAEEVKKMETTEKDRIAELEDEFGNFFDPDTPEMEDDDMEEVENEEVEETEE